MKTFRRIMAVVLLILAIMVFSYCVYTAGQIPPTETTEVIYEAI